MESSQKVPDFLKHFAPSDNILVFDDDSNDSQDGDADEANGSGMWAVREGGKENEQDASEKKAGSWNSAEEVQNAQEQLLDVSSLSLNDTNWGTEAQSEPTNNW
jgi:hypothetical protein